MRPPLIALLLTSSLSLSCQRADPWAPCRETAVQFSGSAPACTTPACRACEAQLDEVWGARRDPAKRAEFRAHFMRSSADARDRFVAKRRPDGPFAYEHCTAGTVRGASCAMYSPTCVEVFARALRSGETTVPLRTQMNLAVDRACDAPRRELVRQLSTCGDQPGAAGCTDSACRDCMVGHLAALSILAPTADQADRAEEFQALIRGTTDPVERAIAEVLGAPDTPVDLDPVVVRRGLRAYCVDLLAHSAAGIPFACHAPLGRLATHPEYAREFAEVWGALHGGSIGAVRGVLDRVLDALAAQATPAPELLQQLDAMRPAFVVEAYRRAAALPSVTPGAAAALRERLDRMGPVVAPAAPAPPPSDAACGGGPAV